MKRTMLLLGLLLTFDVNAQATYITGNALLEHCGKVESNTSSFTDGVCMGFIAGVADAMAIRTSGTRACIPSQSVPLKQVVAVSLKYLRDNPAELHYSGFTNVAVALSKAFPCK